MAKERTEKAIMDTFLLLLNQNPLDKITVKDIVSACGISRNTFYYHYQDIYDLLRATFAAVVDRVLQENVTTWQESLRSCTSFALENRRAVYHVYRSAYREDLERSLYRVSEERMERLIRAPDRRDDRFRGGHPLSDTFLQVRRHRHSAGMAQRRYARRCGAHDLPHGGSAGGQSPAVPGANRRRERPGLGSHCRKTPYGLFRQKMISFYLAACCRQTSARLFCPFT